VLNNQKRRFPARAVPNYELLGGGGGGALEAGPGGGVLFEDAAYGSTYAYEATEVAAAGVAYRMGEQCASCLLDFEAHAGTGQGATDRGFRGLT
jgi:hypothetical protein